MFPVDVVVAVVFVVALVVVGRMRRGSTRPRRNEVHGVDLSINAEPPSLDSTSHQHKRYHHHGGQAAQNGAFGHDLTQHPV